MFTFKCTDIGMDDNFEIKDDDEEEILKIITLHAQNFHDIKTLSPEMIGKIKKAIQSDSNCGTTCSDYA
jgi:predicted small metal-binding protein